MTILWRIAVLLAVIQATVATPWATAAQEALDEKNDAEIFRAVVNSMQQWHKKHDTHRRRKRAESQVCYDGLGCFQDSGPFGYLDMLPSKPEEVGTRFLLYASRVEPALDVPFANLSQVWPWAERAFNFSVPTKVIVHGFGSDCDHVWVYEMKSALMAVENCNVICIDWGNGAAVPNYVRASANTRLVGKQLALLLAGLQSRLGLDLETTHVIGFSLGAHVAGFAGAQLNNLSRITGLDPAGPLFESQDPRARLDSSDAMFVDVIHSNGENLILGGLGSWQPMGHVDFYPNGGRMQKGCSNLFVGAVTDILWSATEVEGRSLCNHRRAYKFFTDSLSPRCHFPAFPCESYEKFLEGSCFPCAGDKRCGNMGYYADKSNVRGTLFLITRDEEPFCAHQYHVRIESAPSVPPAVSYGKIQITLVGSENINETFTLTQKDDAEIRVGVPLTRIAVPHPALQEPRSVQLMYTAYSGWISSGLSKWGIDKLSLTDSFGKSMSVCKKGLMLDSGVPVTLPLYPGECNPPRTNVSSSSPPPLPVEAPPPQNRTSTSSSLLDFFRFKPTPVVQMGDEILDKTNLGQHTTLNPLELTPGGHDAHTITTTNPFALPKVSVDLHDAPPTLDIVQQQPPLGHLPWMPVEYVDDNTHTNSLQDRDMHEDSRAFNTEDILVLGEQPPNRTVVDTNTTNSNFSVINVNIRFNVGTSNASEATDITVRPEIKEPILLSTTSRIGSLWEDGGDGDASSKNKTSTFRPRAIALVNDASATVHITTWRPEIKEPILNPTTPKSKAVKTRHVTASSNGNYENTWIPKQELKPPPLGSSWHHWNMKDDVATPFEEWRRGGNTGGAAATNYHPLPSSGGVAGSPPVREMYASPRVDINVNDANLLLQDVVIDDNDDAVNDVNTSSHGTEKTTTTTTTSSSKRSGRQMLTIQLFPHRLAALLSQAERYARGQFTPFAKQKKTREQQTSTVSRKLNTEEIDDNNNTEYGPTPTPQRRPKYFPNMQEGIQSLSLNNPIQLLLNIFGSGNNNNNNNNNTRSKSGGGEDDEDQQVAKSVGNVVERESTVRPMEVTKTHVEHSVSRDVAMVAHSRVLVPYAYDTSKDGDHKYIPLKEPPTEEGSDARVRE